ncbi:PREDICTED: leucine-rich repeat-containing protein 20-like isoform X3 [Branchiostoma belcheri]|uniref:Leucine-rich repeat-containing protein 20-like isoform X3 n=1 Tax=Branchiostoma belcheri TaxID=7741 RepID=A0A6P4ZZU1_BRABE|nr:PREDICTED: leucine-rich repeat-containing protein 20-like isoform X3 [Branchiostoma belcheri]
MAAASVTRVVRRCEEAKSDGNLGTCTDLASCELTSFPVAVYQLLRNTEVHCCILNSNLLKLLPKRLPAQFPHLQELQLSRNQLQSLPAELQQLQQLQRLDISHNRFSIFPEAVFQLKALVSLNASNNAIVGVDVGKLGGMESVADVDLQANPLAEAVHNDLQQLPRPKVTVSPWEEHFQDME